MIFRRRKFLVKTLTSKAIRLFVKRHVSISEITEQYGISQEDLLQVIKKFFPQHEEARRIWNSLEKNSKHEKTDASQQSDLDQEQFSSVLSSEETVQEQFAQSELSQLKKTEGELSLTLIGIESQHKKLVAHHRSSQKTLLSLKKELDALNQTVERYRKKLSETLEEVQTTSEEMAKVNKMRKETSAELCKLRAKILELQKVTIFFYENGTFEVENGEIPAASSDALNKLFGELVLMPQASEFSVTLKEVKSIAQLLLWTKELKSQNIPFEVVFDRKSVEDFYRLVSA